MEMRSELKRTDRLTPQRSSPGWGGGGFIVSSYRWICKGDAEVFAFGEGEMDGLTRFDNVGKLLPNRQKQGLFPEVMGLRFGDSEGPGSAVDVARIFPYRLDPSFEKVDRIPETQVLEWELVHHFPECLDGYNVFKYHRQATLVVSRRRVLIMVEGPCVLKRCWSDPPKHVQLEGVAVRGVRNRFR